MPKYTKRPIEIEAVQILSNDPLADPLIHEAFANGKLHFEPNGFVVETLEGMMYAPFGAYLICGAHGEFYPCQQDIFVETYDHTSKDAVNA